MIGVAVKLPSDSEVFGIQLFYSGKPCEIFFFVNSWLNLKWLVLRIKKNRGIL